MKEDLKKKKKRNKILKRIFQLTLLLFLFAALAMAIYMAVASTRLMQKRQEQQEAASIAAASRAAEATRQTQATLPEESTGETTTEAETTTEEETSGFSFVDLFSPDLFDEEVTTEEETTISSTDYASLTELYANEKRIWMGDSRFVGLSNSVKTSSTDVFISKGAQSFDWFRDEGVPQLMQELNKDPERIVIINFGLNDCANNCAGWREYFAEDYVELINQLTVTYPNTRFCFASVGLIDGSYTSRSGQKMSAAQIGAFVDDFNTKMYVGCVAEYIDLCEYLIRDGYTTVDGVHFNAETNKKIYNYCVAKAGKYKK